MTSATDLTTRADRCVPTQLALSVEGVDLRTAAAFGWVTPTGYDLINTVGGVRPGDRVLIHAAAGGVGTRAAQFAVAAGAGEVVSVVGTPAQVSSRPGMPTGCTEGDR